MLLKIVLVCLVAEITALELKNIQEEWRDFQTKHNRFYGSKVEKSKRFQIFSNNYDKCSAHNERYNQGLETYKMGITKFADWTSEEFMHYVGGQRTNQIKKDVVKHEPEELMDDDFPDELDWRQLGAVTEVKDQGSCAGGDYAFATAAVLESKYQMTTSILVNMSVQNLLDCNGNKGCEYGEVYQTIFTLEHVGVELERDYPFEGISGECRYNRTKAVLSTTGPVTIGPYEYAVKKLIAERGPTSVQISVTESMQFYVSGVFSDPNCGTTGQTDGNKYMVAVGYGTDNGTDFYILKNSWGINWGEEGYLRLARNKNNMCNIANNVVTCFVIPPHDSP